jgi:hypothetical protein
MPIQTAQRLHCFDRALCDVAAEARAHSALQDDGRQTEVTGIVRIGGADGDGDEALIIQAPIAHNGVWESRPRALTRPAFTLFARPTLCDGIKWHFHFHGLGELDRSRALDA